MSIKEFFSKLQANGPEVKSFEAFRMLRAHGTHTLVLAGEGDELMPPGWTVWKEQE